MTEAEAQLLATIHDDLKGIVIPALARVQNQGARILTELSDLQAVVSDLSADVGEIVTLIQNSNTGSGISAADAQVIVASLQDLHAKLQAVIPAPAPPPTPVSGA